MIVCPVCRCMVPERLILCPVCIQRSSDAAMAAAQLEPLRQVLAGEGPLTIRAIQGKRHIQMFGGRVTFCKLVVGDEHRKSFHDWGIDDPGNLCRYCLQAVTEAMHRAAPESAREIQKGAPL